MSPSFLPGPRKNRSLQTRCLNTLYFRGIRAHQPFWGQRVNLSTLPPLQITNNPPPGHCPAHSQCPTHHSSSGTFIMLYEPHTTQAGLSGKAVSTLHPETTHQSSVKTPSHLEALILREVRSLLIFRMGREGLQLFPISQ